MVAVLQVSSSARSFRPMDGVEKITALSGPMTTVCRTAALLRIIITLHRNFLYLRDEPNSDLKKLCLLLEGVFCNMHQYFLGEIFFRKSDSVL